MNRISRQIQGWSVVHYGRETKYNITVTCRWCAPGFSVLKWLNAKCSIGGRRPWFSEKSRMLSSIEGRDLFPARNVETLFMWRYKRGYVKVVSKLYKGALCGPGQTKDQLECLDITFAEMSSDPQAELQSVVRVWEPWTTNYLIAIKAPAWKIIECDYLFCYESKARHRMVYVSKQLCS